MESEGFLLLFAIIDYRGRLGVCVISIVWIDIECQGLSNMVHIELANSNLHYNHSIFHFNGRFPLIYAPLSRLSQSYHMGVPIMA